MRLIKDIITDLQKPLRIPEDVDFRVGSTKSPKGVTVLAYKDARVDMRRLDEVTDGAWQVAYERDSKGSLIAAIEIYCNIGTVKHPVYHWVRKTSNGSESNQDADKGQFSDAFKRAGFMWGIGRELYDMPFIFISYESGEDKFSVMRNMEWSVKDGYLIATKKGKQRFKGKLGSVYVPDEANENPVASPQAANRINKGNNMLTSANKDYCIKQYPKAKEKVEEYLSKVSFTPEEWKEITGTDWVGGDKFPV